MSVIHDALKTNQRERAARRTRGEAHVLEGFFPFSEATSRRRDGRSRVVIVAASMGLLLVVIAVVVFATPLRHAFQSAGGSLGGKSSAGVPSQSGGLASPRTGRPTPQPGQNAGKGAQAAPLPRGGHSATILNEAHSASPNVATAGEESTHGRANARLSGTRVPAAESLAGDVARLTGGDNGRSNTGAMPDSAAATSAVIVFPVGNTASGVKLEGPAPRQLDLRVNQGVDAMKRGNYAAANEIFKSAVSLGTSRELFLDWALTLTQLGDLDGAAVKYREALDVDPTWVDAMIGFARLLDDQHDTQGATAWLDKAMKLEPQNVTVLLAYADQYDRQLGDLESAKRVLNQVVAFDPANARAHLHLANVMLRLADTTGAVREYNSAIRFAGSDPAIHVQEIQDLLKRLPGGTRP